MLAAYHMVLSEQSTIINEQFKFAIKAKKGLQENRV